jgi:membrane-associated protease RseP (regulator of RpoE activity)
MSSDLSSPPTAPAPVRRGAPRRNRSILEIVLYTAIFVALLWWWAGWSLPVIILLILIMVMVHEFGHYLTARWTGMKATQFFVGFGPRVWSRTRGETEFGVKAIWLGGYVRILGMTSQEELDDVDEPRSFRQASYPRRVLVASAGSIMHLFMALILAWCAILVLGPVTGDVAQVGGFTTWSDATHTAAQVAGLKVGDEILSVDGHSITANDANTGLTEISSDWKGVPLTLVVLRDGHQIHVTATPREGGNFTYTDDGTVVKTSKGVGYLGFGYSVDAVRSHVSVLQSVPDAFTYLGSIMKAIGVGMYHVFSPAGVSNIVKADTNPVYANSPQFVNSDRPTSIYGIVEFARQIATQNPSALLILFMVINLAIGALNMLPMLPLDGGYVAIATYERLRTRKGQPAYHADVNKLMPVVYAFVALLLVIALSSLYLDIRHLPNL